jgi:hypothetical protein
MASRTFLTNSTATKSVAVDEILSVEIKPDTQSVAGTLYYLSMSTTWTVETFFECSTDFDNTKKRLKEIVKILEDKE